MNVAEPTVDGFPNPVLTYIAATRPPFILATVMPILLGLAFSVYQNHSLHWFTAALTLLAGMLLHAAVIAHATLLSLVLVVSAFIG